VFCFFQSKKFPGDVRTRPCPGAVCQSASKRSGSRYGSGLSKTAFTTLNIAVFAPIPSASVSTAIAVTPGRFNSIRKPKWKS
jgi:hypothetical protein